jgi:hypothetical protein
MQGSRWFGGLCGAGYGAEILPKWVRYLRMTATATLFTSSGFAMAADGRRSWGHRPTLKSRQGESDTVQKIFEITRADSTFAYCIRGDTVNEDMSWDIAAEIQSSVVSLSPKRFANPTGFIRALCLDIQERIEDAKQRRQLEDYPTSDISFAGYFSNAPCWVEAQFRPYQARLLHHITARDCDPGRNFMSGSQILNSMIQGGDPRVAYLFVDLNDEKMSLETAACFARKYVETCCSPLIRGLEPDGCTTVGGHIHVAMVTPHGSSWIRRYITGRGSKRSQPTGFQWVTPPSGPA